MKRRIGKFVIDRGLFDQAFNNEICTKDLQEILSNFLVVRAEMIFYRDSVEYHAYSTLFDVIPEGVDVPVYELQIEYSIAKDEPTKLKLLEVIRI